MQRFLTKYDSRHLPRLRDRTRDNMPPAGTQDTILTSASTDFLFTVFRHFHSSLMDLAIRPPTPGSTDGNALDAYCQELQAPRNFPGQ